MQYAFLKKKKKKYLKPQAWLISGVQPEILKGRGWNVVSGHCWGNFDHFLEK